MIYFELKKREFKERINTLKNIQFYLDQIKKVATKELKNPEIIIFGSFLTDKFSPLSDIDIAIISENVKNRDRGEVLSQIKKAINFNPLFEIHLLTPEEFSFYKQFIRDKYKRI